ncbi:MULTISPECIES: response regulator [Actinomyces]|uniref:Response regulator transcription factor n=1 Tax=Actinomyces respiraculi TaxID=2744574 RepID=A0A7T0LJX8_9ACTO|nr:MULTISPECIES: response regulator transcription factor [Actinomyces]QPL05022.1 response regulator transcription factor [Actinomyces respiraculi]
MKVLVVDDNAIVRIGLLRVLEQVPDVTEVRQASDGVEAIEVARSFSPEIVLLDVRMPRMNGLEALPSLVERARVIMLTSADDAESISTALARGASGYLVHGSLGIEDVSGAISTCRQGGMVLSAAAAKQIRVADAPQGTDPHPLSGIVSEREALVLEAASQGLSNVDIAREHFLSPRTVKNYLNAAYVKLGVHNRAEAVIAWREARGEPDAPGR